MSQGAVQGGFLSVFQPIEEAKCPFAHIYGQGGTAILLPVSAFE